MNGQAPLIECAFLGRIYGTKPKDGGPRPVTEFCMATHGPCLIDTTVASIENCTRRAWLLVAYERETKRRKAAESIPDLTE